MNRSPVTLFGKTHGTIPQIRKSQLKAQQSSHARAIGASRPTRLTNGNARKRRVRGSATTIRGCAARTIRDEVNVCHPVNGVPGPVPPNSTTLLAGKKKDTMNDTHA